MEAIYNAAISFWTPIWIIMFGVVACMLYDGEHIDEYDCFMDYVEDGLAEAFRW